MILELFLIFCGNSFLIVSCGILFSVLFFTMRMPNFVACASALSSHVEKSRQVN